MTARISQRPFRVLETQKAASSFGELTAETRKTVAMWLNAKCRSTIPEDLRAGLKPRSRGCTVPAHPTVQHDAIVQADGKGFVITLAPMSYFAPHQCVYDLKYYMRAGSDFSPVPHAVLAGMFGRRPQAALIHNWLGVSHASRLAGHERTPLSSLSLTSNCITWVRESRAISTSIWKPGHRALIVGSEGTCRRTSGFRKT